MEICKVFVDCDNKCFEGCEYYEVEKIMCDTLECHKKDDHTTDIDTVILTVGSVVGTTLMLGTVFFFVYKGNGKIYLYY